MASKVNKSLGDEDCNQNGWDLDEDDNWDDWGDAEDNIISEMPKADGAKTDNVKTPVNNNIKQPEASNRDNNNVMDRLAQTAKKPAAASGNESGGWGSLFGGVMSSVLSTATELTSTVTQGLDKVIGVPDPEEMARINAFEEARQKAQAKNEATNRQEEPADEAAAERAVTPSKEAPIFGLGLVNNVTSLGSKVLNTGLDTLEGIGKKTMNILQENDPLIKNKIKKLGLEKEKPNLTEILMEAKKETEQMEQSMKEMEIEKMRAQLRFEYLFETNCGLVHLEALEILSRESQLKIQTLKDSVSGKALNELVETLNEVKELMDLEDLECEPEAEEYSGQELNDQLKAAIEDVDLQINFEEIVSLWSSTLEWMASDAAKDTECQPIFAKAITTLAETCALEILKLHKMAELLLIKDHHSTANEVDAIVQLCRQFNMHLQVMANRFAALLSGHEQEAKDDVSTIFAEMLQARQQIENAFKLFLPILQIGAV